MGKRKLNRVRIGIAAAAYQKIEVQYKSLENIQERKFNEFLKMAHSYTQLNGVSNFRIWDVVKTHIKAINKKQKPKAKKPKAKKAPAKKAPAKKAPAKKTKANKAPAKK